ncbi:MAG TPA: hypothetical protein VF559_12885 [Caulobacteraceae bacterium]
MAALALAVAPAAPAAPAAAQQKAGSSAKAEYWVSAATTAGMGGMMGAMMAQQGMSSEDAMEDAQAEQPAMGAVLGGALGGNAGAAIGGLFGGGRRAAPPPQARRQATPARPPAARVNYTRTLELDLGSTGRPTGEPSAEHLPPAGLQAGPSLPLVTPRNAPVAPQTYDSRGMGGGGARGRMLIYWGCGEHAAGPPITIDLSKIGPGMKAPNFPTVTADPGTPPAAGRHATFGEWPNERSRVEISPQGSLVGEHVVRGNYSPEIRFALDQTHDFMTPLNVSSAPSGGGGTRVSWNSVQGATGYFAWMMGSGGQDDTMVMWSSSATAVMFGAFMDYLPPSEVRRLIGQRVVLPPTTTQCVVPTEVVQAAPVGMLQMIAYGDEVNVSNPPRPANAKAGWSPDWTVKVRYKSTGSAMLGMLGMGD